MRTGRQKGAIVATPTWTSVRCYSPVLGGASRQCGQQFCRRCISSVDLFSVGNRRKQNQLMLLHSWPTPWHARRQMLLATSSAAVYIVCYICIQACDPLCLQTAPFTYVHEQTVDDKLTQQKPRRQFIIIRPLSKAPSYIWPTKQHLAKSGKDVYTKLV